MRCRVILGLLAVACGEASSRSSINIFTAVDSSYYLAITLCGWLRAYYELKRVGHSERVLQFYLLYRAPLTATRVCESAEAVLTSDEDGAAAWRGCATFRHEAAESRGCGVGSEEALSRTKTVNAIEMAVVPDVLAAIFEGTRNVWRAGRRDEAGGYAMHCSASSARLVNLFNLAPDVIDVFLRPLGVTRVLALDADAWVNQDFVDFYDRGDAATWPVAALARTGDQCAWPDKWNYRSPLVRATIGGSDAAANHKRFKASVLLFKDLGRYCDLGIPTQIADLLEWNVARERFWDCGGQQPPLNLAAANHTDLVRGDWRRVDVRDEVFACEGDAADLKLHVVTDGCKSTNAIVCHERDEALDRVLAAITPPEGETRHEASKAARRRQTNACECLTKSKAARLPSPENASPDTRERGSADDDGFQTIVF